MANGGSNPYNLSDQDVQDLQQIQSQLQPGDPRYGKVTALLATKPSPPAPPTPPVPWYKAQPSPGTESGILSRTGQFLAGGVDPLINAVLHPIQTVEGMGAPSVVGMTPGGYPSSAYTGTSADVANAQVRQQAQQQAVEQGKTMVTQHPAYLAGSLLVPAAVAGSASGSLEGAQSKYVSPQAQAAELTKAINPPAGEYPSLGRNLTAQTGNVVDFANRTGNPLRTSTDFAQAAQGAGYETQQYFNNKFIDPIANQEVSIAGSGYQGRTVGEGQRATIGAINDRISQINDLLRSNYIKRRTGQVMQATAEDADLQAEHGALVNILHDAISTRLGVDPAEIAGLRQRAGQLYSIADQTTAAVNDRVSGYQKQLYGQTLPESGTQAAFQILNRLRGGPEANASRALRTALSSTTIPSTELPTPSPFQEPIQPARSLAWLTPPQSQPVPSVLEQGVVTPADVMARESAMQARMNQVRAMQQAAAAQRARNLAQRPQRTTPSTFLPPGFKR